MDIVELLIARKSESFDGECHLTNEEADAIASEITRLTRERDEARAKAIEEVRALQDLNADAHRIITRIWAVFGNPSYGELNGRTIYDLVQSAVADTNRLRNKVPARCLTDSDLASEIAAVDAMCAGGFGEGGGSPGEWWYERADELEHDRKRRELERQVKDHAAAVRKLGEQPSSVDKIGESGD